MSRSGESGERFKWGARNGHRTYNASMLTLLLAFCLLCFAVVAYVAFLVDEAAEVIMAAVALASLNAFAVIGGAIKRRRLLRSRGRSQRLQWSHRR